MTDGSSNLDTSLDGPAVTCCTSCYRVHSDDQHCPCLIDRAETLARESWEVYRQTVAGWRRPRTWDELPERARQDRTADALCVVDALEAAGWRMVTTRAPGRHTLGALGAAAIPLGLDPEPVTDPAGMSPVSGVIQ